MIVEAIKAPFPAIGGKRRIASLVWERFGDVSNYIEPFCFSAAVLLNRPTSPRIETINDANHFVANFWRATAADPDAVADAADWPVNEADLHSRHRWLVYSDEARALAYKIKESPDYFDAKVAGWWAWGACCWIGSGWCEMPEWEGRFLGALNDRGLNSRTLSNVPEQMPSMEQCQTGGKGVNGVVPTEKRPNPHSGCGVHKTATTPADWNQIPSLRGKDGAAGMGVHASGPRPRTPADWDQMPSIGGWDGDGSGGRGVHSKRPRVPSGAGGYMPGVINTSDTHRPQLADAFSRGRGIHGNDQAETCADRRAWLRGWFGQLRDRLRVVRVCCGDWLRVCDSPSVTTRLGVSGVFLDPPYRTTLASGKKNRSKNLYANDKTQDLPKLVDDVIAYCAERGADPKMRLAACCLEGEGYEVLADLGWTSIEWKSSGYGNRSVDGAENNARERVWFSPHCIDPSINRQPLFRDLGED